MPTILPELVARRMHGQNVEVDGDDAEEQKPANPYVQYIHTPTGDAPEPLESRKGVVIWNHRG
jgi:hypothetical protein